MKKTHSHKHTHTQTHSEWVCELNSYGCFFLGWRQKITSWPYLGHLENKRAGSHRGTKRRTDKEKQTETGESREMKDGLMSIESGKGMMRRTLREIAAERMYHVVRALQQAEWGRGKRTCNVRTTQPFTFLQGVAEAVWSLHPLHRCMTYFITILFTHLWWLRSSFFDDLSLTSLACISQSSCIPPSLIIKLPCNFYLSIYMLFPHPLTSSSSPLPAVALNFESIFVSKRTT